jgi:hypothetical protein
MRRAAYASAGTSGSGSSKQVFQHPVQNDVESFDDGISSLTELSFDLKDFFDPDLRRSIVQAVYRAAMAMI